MRSCHKKQNQSEPGVLEEDNEIHKEGNREGNACKVEYKPGYDQVVVVEEGSKDSKEVANQKDDVGDDGYGKEQLRTLRIRQLIDLLKSLFMLVHKN